MIARGGAEDKGDEPAVGISGGAFYCLAHVGINAASVLAMANELAVLCVQVALDYRWRPAAAIPDDDLVTAAAVTGGGDVIATFLEAAGMLAHAV